MARNWSINKPTDLRNESLLNINFNSDSFESGYLNSPSHFSSSTIDDINHLGMEENQSPKMEISSLISKQIFALTMKLIPFRLVHPLIVNLLQIRNLFLDEPWKSSRVNFLNNWKQSEDAFGKIIFQNY